MFEKTAQAFVDGAFLRNVAKALGQPLINPYMMLMDIKGNRRWDVRRVTYYDAVPEKPEDNQDLEGYMSALERESFTHLGFGSLRGSKPRKQKAVDTLLAVQMVSGAINKNFDLAILVAGDRDFVPVVEEVQRHGVNVVLVTSHKKNCFCSESLERSADMVELIDSLHRGGGPPIRVLNSEQGNWGYDDNKVVFKPRDTGGSGNG